MRSTKPIRAGLIATTPAGLALAKVFQALNRTKNLEMRVFDDEAVARSWIGAKPAPGSL